MIAVLVGLALVLAQPLTLDPEPRPSARCVHWTCPTDGPCVCQRTDGPTRRRTQRHR